MKPKRGFMAKSSLRFRLSNSRTAGLYYMAAAKLQFVNPDRLRSGWRIRPHVITGISTDAARRIGQNESSDPRRVDNLWRSAEALLIETTNPAHFLWHFRLTNPNLASLFSRASARLRQSLLELPVRTRLSHCIDHGSRAVDSVASAMILRQPRSRDSQLDAPRPRESPAASEFALLPLQFSALNRRGGRDGLRLIALRSAPKE
jgi:hypothetical protein